MEIRGINDKNEIAGSYYDANNVLHAFSGTLNGQYRTFDVKRSGSPFINAINNGGEMVGWGVFGKSADGFELNGRRQVLGTLQNKRAAGLNNSGTFVGYDVDDGTSFYGADGKYESDIDLGVEANPIEVLGINGANWLVGWAVFSSVQSRHAFLFKDGSVTLIDYPGAGTYDTVPLAISDQGLVVGAYQKEATFYGFSYNVAKGEFQAVTVKHAKSVVVAGVNNRGYMTVTTDIGPFVYCPYDTKKQCLASPP